jgi:hypothetical protein
VGLRVSSRARSPWQARRLIAGRRVARRAGRARATGSGPCSSAVISLSYYLNKGNFWPVLALRQQLRVGRHQADCGVFVSYGEVFKIVGVSLLASTALTAVSAALWWLRTK